MRSRVISVWIRALACLLGPVGCVPSLTIDDMKAMKIERPAETDRLRLLAGRWESIGTAKIAGLEEDLVITGRSHGQWHTDRWVLVNEDVFTLGTLGDMKALTVWRWDARSKRYRTTWFYNDGSTGTGSARYDEKTKTWHLRTKGRGPWGGLKGKGTITHIDEDSVRWTWREWDSTGLVEIMSFEGISKRSAGPSGVE